MKKGNITLLGAIALVQGRVNTVQFFITKMPKTLEDVADSGSHVWALDKGLRLVAKKKLENFTPKNT
ncbi:hypothetical protein [Dolichospermum circinale]|uniref:hypothetical protein n=1 Tax=Dolichospermum circinale TaxID=109265 RepID=UPI002330A4C7|nr:hypothetical protein [Dolichospermum circinale]MDB9450719.1 hypothetical protein [Dolichospermum circinale CS-547]